MPIPPKPAPYLNMSFGSYVQGRVQIQSFYYTGGVDLPSASLCDAAASAFANIMLEGLKPCLSHEVLAQGARAEMVTGSDILDGFSPASWTGDVTGDALPNQDVAEIRWHVDRAAGRVLQRGKTYISGTGEVDQSQGQLSSALRANLDALAQLLHDHKPLDDDGWKLSMWSPRDGLFLPIMAWSIGRDYQTLRRRRTSS